MGRKLKSNYRRIYSEYYHIEFGDDMAIHHIDRDRSNNNINNLLLLPKKLHSKYHWYITYIDYDNQILSLSNLYRLPDDLKKVADVLKEMWPWVRLKNQMDYCMFYGVLYPCNEIITENYFRE